MPDREEFLETLKPVLDAVAGKPWDAALAARLAERFPPGGTVFEAIRTTVASGVEDGWMGLTGDDRRKGGRVIEPCEQTDEMSVDVVEIADVVGPHHRHPHGEVCAILAITPGARFDGNPDGWAVYSPGSDHYPSAEGGRLRVMFFLPDGAIEYTDEAASLKSGASR